MNLSKSQALDAMIEHHQLLARGISERVSAVATAVEHRHDHDATVSELIVYLNDEVVPHADAEEQTIYQEAARFTQLTDVVNQALIDHRLISVAVMALANTKEGHEAMIEARNLELLFSAHVTKENDVILPALFDEESCDLAGLFINLQHLTDAVQNRGKDVRCDSEAETYALLCEAAKSLASVGYGDKACQLVASAWAGFRVSRPDLAVRATAQLHALVRLVAAEPIELRSKDAPPSGDAELDVRPLAPSQRHELIFKTFHQLSDNTGYVLINDHDPKPLRYQFEAEHAGTFTWDYLEAGPRTWRVRIGKSEA